MLKTSRQEEDMTLEKQAKFVEERFSTTEEIMAKLCSAFSKFTRRTAKYRDANDLLATALNDYASREQINKTLKICMENMALSLALLGDYRDNSTLYMEEQVMTSLTQYATRCKNSNSEIKNIYGAKEKELNKRRQLTKIRQRLPQSVKAIMKAEGDLVEACSKVSQMQGALEEYALSFERSKLNDMKMILHDFIKAELVFHIGAVEALSKAFVDISGVNVESDYQAFKEVLIRPNMAIRLDIVKNATAMGRRGKTGCGIPRNQMDSGPSTTSDLGIESKRITSETSERTSTAGVDLFADDKTVAESALSSVDEDSDDDEDVSSNDEYTTSMPAKPSWSRPHSTANL